MVYSCPYCGISFIHSFIEPTFPSHLRVNIRISDSYSHVLLSNRFLWMLSECRSAAADADAIEKAPFINLIKVSNSQYLRRGLDWKKNEIYRAVDEGNEKRKKSY
jgi:hypothetical protein